MVLALAGAYYLPSSGGRPHRRSIDVLLRVLVGLAAIAVIVTVVLAGDAGARAVWSGL